MTSMWLWPGYSLGAQIENVEDVVWWGGRRGGRRGGKWECLERMWMERVEGIWENSDWQMSSAVDLASGKAAMSSRLKLLPSFKAQIVLHIARRTRRAGTYSWRGEAHLQSEHISTGHDRGYRSTGLVNFTATWP